MGKGKRKNRENSAFLSVFKCGLFILAVLLIAYIMSRYVIERVTVHNHSMEHTLEPEDSVMIDKISYRFREPERFDIIVFRQKGTGRN